MKSGENNSRKRILSSAYTDSTGIGKLPPQAVELEEAVLGALLLDCRLVPEISTILQPDTFYKEQNGRVFNAILKMYKRGEKAIDILTVTQELKALEELEFVGGAYYISQLTNRVASAAHIETHARYVQQMFLLREIIRLGTQAISQAYEANGDPFDIIADLQKETSNLTSFVTNKIKHVGDIFNDVLDDINQVLEHGLPTGVLSGFKNVDEQTGGWQNGNLIFLAARPGMGKTALALEIAKHPALVLKKPVVIFSIEMSAKELVGRLAASESQIISTEIIQKKINRHQLQTMGARCHELVGCPIYIDDTPALKFSDLKAKAKKMKQEKKIELIVIDYLQLMHGEAGGNREQEISFLTRNLKALAKELDLPIIALSQLSRKVEERPGKRPQLQDLRESGSIEQDGDIIVFIFRPEYYGLFENGYDYGGQTLPQRHLMLFDIAKGRGLQIGEVPLKFYGKYMITKNYDLDRMGGGDLKQIEDPEQKKLENNDNFLNDDLAF